MFVHFINLKHDFFLNIKFNFGNLIIFLFLKIICLFDDQYPNTQDHFLVFIFIILNVIYHINFMNLIS